MQDVDQTPVSVEDARRLFADWKPTPSLVIAVSGGPDSVALMYLLARWRRASKRGPDLVVVTIDHGLRAEAAREARDVKKLAVSLGLVHRTMRWTGDKPKTGIPAAAREARYRLLAKAAAACGAQHVLTAHTRDDQAETVLMRLARGSGVSGLSAMSREVDRGGFTLVRPLLDVPKSRLLATLAKARIAYASDPSNTDVGFTRPRLRALMPTLATEGFDSRNLARLATRLARANEAIELMVNGAEQYLNLIGGQPTGGIDVQLFASLSEEIRIRLLLRLLNRVGYEGPAELGKVETLLQALDGAAGKGGKGGKGIQYRQTLAGALVTQTHNRLRIEPAPSRRSPK